jgi:AcrR family transcriptional regulator
MSGPGTYDRSLTPKERKAIQRRRLLLACAHEFASKGYASATVESIVTSALMSRRTFYEHFDDLAGALLQVHDASARIAIRQVSDAIATKAEPLERLETGISAFLGLVGANGNLARVLFREVRAAGPQYEQRREQLLESFAAMMHATLVEAHQRGLLARGPDELTVYAATASIEAVGMRYVERGEEARILEAVPVLLRLVTSPFR